MARPADAHCMRTMEAAVGDVTAAGPLRWADFKEIDDTVAMESVAPLEPIVRKCTNDLDRTRCGLLSVWSSRERRWPLHTVSELSTNVVDSVTKGDAHAHHPSYEPSGPWQEVRDQRPRFGAVQRRKPGYKSGAETASTSTNRATT